ncbi:MAG TPA: glutathione S-transferase family protein [Usitatibacter sp.]|nr:glutathione S-transferase family protein [Usitatibacter sp.]
MAIDFYHGHGSPYGWRVWLALEMKQLDYNLKILSFASNDTEKPEFVAINPRHKVPTIVDAGFALWESSAIVEYLDERYASGGRLFPGDARQRARIRRLAREAELYFGNEGIDPITDEYFGKQGAAPDMEKVEKARARVKQELDHFARELEGDYLAGDTLSAADFALYPCIGFLKRITFRKPDTQLTGLIPGSIAAWARRIESLPYFDKTIPEHWREGWGKEAR